MPHPPTRQHFVHQHAHRLFFHILRFQGGCSVAGAAAVGIRDAVKSAWLISAASSLLCLQLHQM